VVSRRLGATANSATHVSFELVAFPFAPKRLPVAPLVLPLAADEAALGRVEQEIHRLARPVLGFKNQPIVSFLRA
jgi:hypothetical protein